MKKMRNIIAVLSVFVLCFSVAGCGKEEEKQEQAEQVKEEAPETPEDSPAEEEQTKDLEAESYLLAAEDGSVSIHVKRPEGYTLAEYSTETSLSFQKADGSVNSTIIMRLINQGEEAVAETLMQEIQYVVSANSEQSAVGEIQTKTEGAYEVSYLDYTYDLNGTAAQGRRIFTTLENGSVYVYGAESIGGSLQDIHAEISSMVSGISEAGE